MIVIYTLDVQVSILISIINININFVTFVSVTLIACKNQAIPYLCDIECVMWLTLLLLIT